jgi:hypothetical protein
LVCRWKDPALLLWLRLVADDPRLYGDAAEGGVQVSSP